MKIFIYLFILLTLTANSAGASETNGTDWLDHRQTLALVTGFDGFFRGIESSFFWEMQFRLANDLYAYSALWVLCGGLAGYFLADPLRIDKIDAGIIGVFTAYGQLSGLLTGISLAYGVPFQLTLSNAQIAFIPFAFSLLSMTGGYFYSRLVTLTDGDSVIVGMGLTTGLVVGFFTGFSQNKELMRTLFPMALGSTIGLGIGAVAAALWDYNFVESVICSVIPLGVFLITTGISLYFPVSDLSTIIVVGSIVSAVTYVTLALVIKEFIPASKQVAKDYTFSVNPAALAAGLLEKSGQDIVNLPFLRLDYRF